MNRVQVQSRELETRMNAGLIKWYERKPDEALSRYDSLYSEIESSDDVFLKAKFHNLIGNSYKLKAELSGDYSYLDLTLSEYKTTKEYLNQIDDLPAIGVVENNIADVKLMQGLTAEAHAHLNFAEEILSSFHDTTLLGCVLETRARVYLAEGNIEQAKKAIEKSEELLRKGIEKTPLDETLETKRMIFDLGGEPKEG